MCTEALKRAVKIAGGQKALASKLAGVSQQKISYWLNTAKKVQAEYVLAIEEITGVSRHELRPDLYPIEVKA